MPAHSTGPGMRPSPARRSDREIILATTTSVSDTGLLDALQAAFESRHPYTLTIAAVGTGQALELGRRGEADLLLTHAPEAEKPLVTDGTVLRRRLVMHNDFILAGPPADPAGIRGVALTTEALVRIAGRGAPFVSRGDDSGTHRMERSLWQATGVSTAAPWYEETGSGMAETLRIASSKGGYTLTDRGTYLALRGELQLEVLVEGDPVLLNPYHVLEIDPDTFPGINAQGARAFADFLLSDQAQEIIREYGAGRMGGPLYLADAGRTESQLEAPR